MGRRGAGNGSILFYHTNASHISNKNIRTHRPDMHANKRVNNASNLYRNSQTPFTVGHRLVGFCPYIEKSFYI